MDGRIVRILEGWHHANKKVISHESGGDACVLFYFNNSVALSRVDRHNLLGRSNTKSAEAKPAHILHERAS